MTFPSSYISQSIASQNSMFGGLQAYAQQASYSAGLMGAAPPPQYPAMMPPPPPPTLGGVMRGMGGYAGGPGAGQYGETMAGGMFSAGRTGAGLMAAGVGAMGVAGSLGFGGTMGAVAGAMDPMGLAMRAGAGGYAAAGGGMMGAAAGIGAAGAVALPMYAAYRYASAVGQNFAGGMQDQMALNSTLRQNFNFAGGSGAGGRGFNQGQMGQIGSVIGQELRGNSMTSASELNQLISGGAQMGNFAGTHSVQEFTRRFREMIQTVRTVQRELGGSLTEAQEFINQSRQAGVFGSTQATRFASTIRATSQTTGLEQGQLIQLASEGAQIARSVGGLGRQGAFGALRGASQVATMMSSGMIDESMLSEATGGRTGSEAASAFVTNMMQRTAALSRRPHGRYNIFAMSNADGTGLDEAAMMNFQMGGMGVGETSRRAHARVGEMGRARAINREGILRGAAVEQGGLSFQIGQMRQLLGGREDMSDDLTSLVLQRRGHMSRPEAEIMTSMIRNQGTIAQQEITDRIGSRRDQAQRTEISEHRGVDAFQRELGHALSDELGLTRARELGRSFVTGISSHFERAMNAFLGVADQGMSREVQNRLGRLASGSGSAADLQAIRLSEAAGFANGGGGRTGSQLMETSGFGGPMSTGARLERLGFDVTGEGGGDGRRAIARRAAGYDSRGAVIGIHADGSRIYAGGREMSGRDSDAAIRAMMDAQGGRASGRAGEILSSLDQHSASTDVEIARARTVARGLGDESQYLSHVRGAGGGSDRGLAVTAYMSRHGIEDPMDAATHASVGGILGEGLDALGRGMSAFFGEEHSGDRGMTHDQAVEYFARGGGAAQDLSSLAARDQQIARTGADGAARVRAHRRSSEYRAEAAGMTGASAEAISEVMGREEVRLATQTIADPSSTPAERTAAADRLTRLQNAEPSDSPQMVALASVVANARRAATSDDPVARAALLETSIPSAEREAYRRESQAIGRSYANIAGVMSSERGDGAMNAGQLAVAQLFGEAGNAGQGGAAMFTGMQADLGAMARNMSDEEFSQATAAMGSLAGSDRLTADEQDRVRQAMGGATAMRGQARDIMGHGRRGARGGRERAFSDFSGGSLGDMEFSIGGHRVQGRSAAGMLAGGPHSEEMMRQYGEQLQARGISAEGARDITTTLSDVYRRGGERGEHGEEVSSGEMERLQQLQGRHGEDFARIQREDYAATLSAASSRDPVGQETNRILKAINTTLEARLPAGTSGGDPHEDATLGISH